MPKMPRSEYDRMRRSPLKATRDSLNEMLASGTTVENLPQAEKPSLLGFGKEVAKRILSKSEARAEEPMKVSIGTRMGASWADNIKRRKALNNPDELEGAREWGRLTRESGIEEINEDKERRQPYEAVQKKLKKKREAEGE